MVSRIFDATYEQWKPATYGIPQIPTAEEIAEFRDLLEKARKWDEEHGEPDCGTEEKRQKIQELADELGIEIDFV